MRAYIVHIGAVALFLVGLVFFHSGPAQAEPVNHPDKCPDQMPAEGGFACLRSGGKVICTNDGDVMCCKPNSQGGQDCEQIVAKPFNPMGNVSRPGGNLQMAPMNPPPNTSRFPQPGINAPIMRRGVEGEQPETSTGDSSTPAPESK